MSKISTAKDIRIEDYLSYPELRIPMFQREYVWSPEEIEDFWDDFTEQGIQFLGSIILKDENYDHSKRTGWLEIVDGQQRTVSILLLLKTISRRLLLLARTRKEPYERNAESQAEEISRQVSKRDRNDLTKVLSYKLVLPSKDDDIALKEVLDGNFENVNKKKYKSLFDVQSKFEELFDAYLKKFKSAKQKIDALISLKNSILDIKVIEVLVPTDEDAYMIFEAVNDRGADLGAAELLKNYLFAHTKKDDQVTIFNEWQEIRKTLSEINRHSIDLTGFLRYYWIGEYSHVSKKSLFKGIKKRLSDRVATHRITPEIILKEIKAFRITLVRIFLYDLADWQLLFNETRGAQDKRQIQRRAYEWFTYKKNLDFFPKSIQYLPIYTALVGHLDKIQVSQDPFIDLLLAVEKINFLYSYLLQKQTNRIDRMLSTIGREILEKIHGEDQKAILSKVQSGTSQIRNLLKETVKREEVDNAIGKLSYNRSLDKSIIYFILMNLEYEVGGYSRLLLRDDLTLEHVYPKSIEKKGNLPHWPEISLNDYAELGHGLGNLTLLPATGPQANGSAGEEKFETKRDQFLLPSTFSINKYFNGIKIWNKGEIEKRLEYIKEQVWKRWGY